MTPLDFLLGAVFVILGFGLLSFSVRIADRLPLMALIPIAMRGVGEPMADVIKAIGLFVGVLAGFIMLAMTGSLLFARGLIWLLQL